MMSFNLREYLQRLSKAKLLACLLFWYIITHLLTQPYLRRVSLFLFVLIVLYTYYPTIRSILCRARSYYSRVTIGLLLLSLFVKFLPGGYFPPFFSGIAGWTLEAKTDKKIILSGLQLINQNGEPIWFSHGLTSPANFIHRHFRKYCKQDDALRKMLALYFKLYQRHYPLLKQGYYPSERYLGHLAYPGHNPYKHLPYEQFPPEQIQQLRMVSEIYDPMSLRLIERKVKYIYSPESGQLKRLK